MSLSAEKNKALDVQATCWVNASAGSGKTSILVARILALLLSGVSGRLIVCLTFTKRAAREMQDRLDAHMDQWALCPDHNLAQEIETIVGQTPCAATCRRARSLKQMALKEPVTIQTFHSFCHDVLARFPIESYVNIPLDIWDQAKTGGVWDKALERVLEETDPASYVGQAIARLVHSGTRMSVVFQDMFQQRLLPLEESSDQGRGPTPGVTSGPEADLSGPFLSAEDFLNIAPNPLPELDVWEGEDRIWVEQWQSVTRGSAVYCGLIFQKFSKKTALRHPKLQQWHDQEYAWMQHLVQAQDQKKKMQHDQDLILVFQEIMRQYAALKGGALDFDDLTLKTLDLLENSAYSGWVSHRFYHDLNHILVDEAQDTSRHQWRILRYLIEAVMQHPNRTVCVVGDPKQSIYGFQGADPEGFLLMQQFVRAWVVSVGGVFHDVHLTVSFRSAPAVLSLINQVFSEKNEHLSTFSPHSSFHHQRKGWVEFWANNPSNPDICLAKKWTKTIQGWVQTPFFLPSKQGRVQAEDIMIVLPRRTAFFKALQHHLHASGLLSRKDISHKDDPVLQMLVAWCRIVMCPDDDVALAQWIQGLSVFGKEDWIFSAAYGRGKKSIWQNICQNGYKESQNDILAEQGTAFFSALTVYIGHLRQAKTLKRLLDLVVDWVYADGGWTFLSYASTLGDPQHTIDAFVSALRQWHDPDDGVGFLDWVEKDDTVFKSPHTGGIQLLTIHGAKGAQAPVVILPDLPQPIDKHDPEYWRLLYVALTRAQDRLYLSSRKDSTLWHKAIERAMDQVQARSFFCPDGFLVRQYADGAECLTEFGMRESLPAAGIEDGVGTLVAKQDAPKDIHNGVNNHARSKTDEACLYAPGTFLWLLWGMGKNTWPFLHAARGDGPVTELVRGEKPRNSSNKQNSDKQNGIRDKIGGEISRAIPSDTVALYTYRRRGEALHQLLDELPNISANQWWDTSVRFLTRQGLAVSESQTWAHRLVALLHRADLQPLFFQAWKEVEWSGLGQLRRMDRVLMRPGHLWIVDFKSDHIMADRWQDSAYVGQMQRYVDLMQPLYPDCRVHQGILWLKHGVLLWHPDSHDWAGVDSGAVDDSVIETVEFQDSGNGGVDPARG